MRRSASGRRTTSRCRETEKALGKVKRSLDCSKSGVKRLTQPRELEETVNVSQEAAEFKDLEPANSEVSVHISTCIVNHNHVSEANLARKFANSSSRNVFESHNSASVHVERMNPVWGARISSFPRVLVATRQESPPRVSSIAASQAAAFHSAADLSKPKELFTRPAKPAWRSPTPMEEKIADLQIHDPFRNSREVCDMWFCHHFWNHQVALRSNLQGCLRMTFHTEKKTHWNWRDSELLQLSTIGIKF